MTRRTGLIAAAGLALAIYALIFGSSYDQRLLTLSGVYVILVLGYQFIFGHAGALSLAQGAFFGVGAYATGILGARYGAEFLITFPISIALAAGFAALVAIPVLRLKSHYFALATLALSQLLLLIAVNWEPVTGGANGIPGVPPVTLFGWTLTRGLPLLAFVWVLVGLAAAIVHWQLKPSRIAAFTIMRDTPLAAPALGIDSGLLRFRAFLLSAAFGGAAGALFAHTNRVVSPETLGFGVMITCLTMTVVGGRFGILGALIGALLLTHLPEWFRSLEEYYLVAVGILLLVSVIFAPNGIVALLPRRQPAGESSNQPNVDGDAVGFVAAGEGLAVLGISKSYGGVQALDDVSLHIMPGEIVGIIGPNGAGKTTLANAISGATIADQGLIRLGTRDITIAPAHDIARWGIARTFQTPQLPDDLSVSEIVEAAQITATNPNLPSVDTALTFCGLHEYSTTSCGTLAHGIRRRVEICRALAARPQVLILDEPAAGLSAEEQEEISVMCRKLADAGMAVLLIDHNIGFLQPLATRLACLEAGVVIADDTPDLTLANPRVRDAYFGMAEL